MLYVSLVLSLGLVLVANLTVFYPKTWGHPVKFLWAIPGMFFVGCGVVGFPPAVVIAIALSLALVPWMLGWAKPRTFVPVSLAAFALAWGGVLYGVWIDYAEYRRIAVKYPFESLEHRLPPKARGEAVETDDEGGPVGSRAFGLKVLHEQTTHHFANSPGFGVHRGILHQREALLALKRFEKTDAVVAQAEPSFSASLAAMDAIATERYRDAAGDVHRRAVDLFLDPNSFGYVRSRKETAGFVGHRFTKSPADDPGDVRSLDLIGLVMHREPVAYVSANLPRMDELRDAPTRPLTPFEAEAVARLRMGEELIAARAGDRIRAVGAIRNGGRCRTCHDHTDGGLLGAFSYVLAAPRD